MKLFPLFINTDWLRQNGLDSARDVVLKASVWILTGETTARRSARLHNKVRKFRSKLRVFGVKEFEGGIERSPDDTDVVLFRDQSGRDYRMDPFKPHSNIMTGVYYPDMFVLGIALTTDEPRHLLPIAVYKKTIEPDVRTVDANALHRLPVGIEGLAELLFPDLDTGKRGFANPKTDDVIPRVFVVKGAVGTGKTTLATQIMATMARCGFACDYWCSNDDPKAIRNTALSFKFCTENEYETWAKERISVVKIAEKYRDCLRLLQDVNPAQEIVSRLRGARPTKGRLLQRDVLFFDSLNVSQIGEGVDRQALWHIFQSFRDKPLLSIFLLEDYGADGTEKVRQLISDCEFLADVVIELKEDTREGYHAKSLCIKKKHYGAQVYGTHFYKICPPEHSLPNLSQGGEAPPNTGIVVYPSIHRYLSRARTFGQSKPVLLVNTGITHLDAILSGGSQKKPKSSLDKGCIEQNSCVVISGERGGHKLPLGLNLLMGGLWKIERGTKKTGPRVVADRDVLLLLLDEEADILIDCVATARRTHLFTGLKSRFASLDNGKWITWKSPNHKSHPRDQECDWFDLIDKEKNIGKKVIFKRWCASIASVDGRPLDCRKLVVAGFRPGCITPEEFIYIVSRLLKASAGEVCPFSRVLFVSTAHLQNRFPLLSKSRLFLPAMVDLFKSQNILSTFIDIKGVGADRELSYGLSALADYLISVDKVASHEYRYSWPDELDTLDSEDNRQRYIMSRMDVENVRGKEYSRPCHLLTVRPRKKPNGNDLYILNGNPHGGKNQSDTPKTM